MAQAIPTVDQVGIELNTRCERPDLVPLPNLADCLVAIAEAVDVAAAYSLIADVPPQVQIGFLLCLLAIARPELAPFITAIIEASNNPNLRQGCSLALIPEEGPGEGIAGSPPVITPG